MSSIGLPLPLLDVGLRPQPFVAPDADVRALGGLGDDTLADLFRELLFELHECFELLIWTGDRRSVFSPSPIWPLLLRPHAQMLPSAVAASA